MGAAVLAQAAPPDSSAFITLIRGDGDVWRIKGEERSPVSLFPLENNTLDPGEGVQTEPGTTAVVMLPGYGAIVYLEESSELYWVAPVGPTGKSVPNISGVGPVLRLTKGRASVVRKSDHTAWLVVAAEGEAASAAGYTISKGASLVVEAAHDHVRFSIGRGEALCFAGRVPAGALVGPSGDLLDASGVVLKQGQSVFIQAPPVPQPETEVVAVVPSRLGDDMYRFGLTQGNAWLRRAEEGDFIPKRSPGRGAPLPLAPELEPSLVFDQPRAVQGGVSPRPTPGAVRATLSPGQTLAESDVPATAVAGQRFRRTRIIGPGVGPAGSIRINPAARSLIRLRRQ
jgi:hypothetical protein